MAYVAVLFALAVGMPIGAVVLRAAVALCNKMATGSSSLAKIPEPDLHKSMGVMFVVILVRIVVMYALADPIIVGQAGDHQAATTNLSADLISLAASLLAMVFVLLKALPCNFKQSILVTLFFALIAAVIFGIIAGIVFTVYASNGIRIRH